jgi:predicted peptidase
MLRSIIFLLRLDHPMIEPIALLQRAKIDMFSNSMLRCAGFCLFAIFAGGCADPSGAVNQIAPQNTGFITRKLDVGGTERKYTVFVPFTYEPTKLYPTIVFLHGLGEAGSDGHHCLTEGLAPYIAKHPESFPFIVVFAQSAGDWTGADRAQMVGAEMEDAEGSYSIDKDRTVLMGYSTGGYGTWRIGAQYADRFAALVPMAAYADSDEVPTLSHLPIWMFHNSGDPFVFAAFSDEMYGKLKAAGADVKYTEYGAFGHNCWSRAYADPKLWEWILAQRRK